jgi:aryl-alcohol dehydrogenase-like predicted oxidoreductase
MKQRTLGAGGLQVSALGLGCMGMSAFYGPTDETDNRATLDRALELGVTFWDTADMYGFGRNETLVGSALTGRRDWVELATKFANRVDADGKRFVDNSPEWIRQACDDSLSRLGTDYIDLYYMHRRNSDVPVEDSVGAMAELVTAGKVRHLGLSEISAETLRAAHAIHPIAAVQTEWSLWSRDIEDEIVPTCNELGIGIVPYSPLGRGALTGAFASVDELAADDFRRNNPRFANLDKNAVLIAAVGQVAKEIGCTPAQAALGWLLAQGENVVPIPGTRKVSRLEENVASADLTLSAEQVQALTDAIPRDAVAGERYESGGMAGLNR